MAIEEHLLAATACLLEQWLPSLPGGGPAWQVEVIGGSAPPAFDEDWETAPSLTEVSEYGRFPATFGVEGNRFPVGVELLKLDGGVDDFRGQRASMGRPDEIARFVIEAVTATLQAGSGPLDQRVRPLVGFLAGGLTEWAGEHLLRIQVAATPGGVPLDEELHLLVRDHRGDACRLSLARAIAVPPASESAGLDARITWNATLLSEFLLMNNNHAVDFKVSIEAHGLVLDTDADAAFRTWKGLGGDDFQLLDGASLATVLAQTESDAADFALFVCLSEDDDHTDPQAPVDHLVIHLLRDLIDTLTKRVAGDGTLLLAYSNGWPLEYQGEGACLVLVGPELVGVIDVDDSY